MERPAKKPCPYGASCYRQNPAHKQEYSHSADAEARPAGDVHGAAGAAAPLRPACPYGLGCKRKNLLHFSEMSHPVGHPLDPATQAALVLRPGVPSLPAFKSYFGRAEGQGAVFEAPTVLERIVMDVLHEVRHKPEWWRKVGDDTLVARWTEELAQSPKFVDMIAHCPNVREPAPSVMARAIAELRWQAQQVGDRGAAYTYSPVDGVFQSDQLVGADLRRQLLAGLADLEAHQERVGEVDWHPGSNGQVRNLFHPSLYCLVRGRTPVLAEPLGSDPASTLQFFAASEVEPRAAQPAGARPNDFGRFGHMRSALYQWLPADVEVRADGRAVLTSYVNNLHPVLFSGLYRCLEDLLSAALPMFERCLTELALPSVSRCTDPDMYGLFEVDEDDEDDEDEDGEEDERKSRPVAMDALPELKAFEPPDLVAHPPVSLRERRLQVVAKVSSIVLTPASPSYAGGEWHIEGMADERIVATFIYYARVENITESRLAFRRAIDDPPYEQNDDRGVELVYNMQNDDPLSVPVGHVVAEQGRCVVFPNTHQHRVLPFQLADPTRPGLRTIVVFFLVDPNKRVLSTARVPAQQRHWLLSPVYPSPVHSGVLEVVSSSADLRALVAEYAAAGVMTEDEAAQYRLQLMEERKRVRQQQNGEDFEREFSLCEH